MQSKKIKETTRFELNVSKQEYEIIMGALSSCVLFGGKILKEEFIEDCHELSIDFVRGLSK